MAEGLPGNCFAEDEVNSLAFLFKQFIGEIEHFNICFYSKEIPDIGKVVKETGVSAGEICRNYISFVLHSFSNEAFMPLEVPDDSFFLS